jgi:hypothetical protein
MNRTELTILAAALEAQEGSASADYVEAERIREALMQGPPLTLDEEAIIWGSPDARDLYFTVRRLVRREAEFALQAAGFGTELRLRAAQSASEMESITGDGFVLTIFCDRVGEDEEWSLWLRVEPELRKTLPQNMPVCLRDSGGLTWIEGKLDAQGQMTGTWGHEAETPYDRLGKFGISIGIS